VDSLNPGTGLKGRKYEKKKIGGKGEQGVSNKVIGTKGRGRKGGDFKRKN